MGEVGGGGGGEGNQKIKDFILKCLVDIVFEFQNEVVRKRHPKLKRQ